MKRIETILWSAVLIFVLSPRTYVWAQTGATSPGDTGATSGGGSGQTITLTNPFNGGTSLYEFIKKVVSDILLPLGGVVVVVMLIYSGFLFVTARGNEKKLGDAKRNFLYVVIGTAVLLGAWTIATVIQNTIDQLKS